VLVTETWLDDSVGNSVITRNTNFNCFRCDRVGKRGGGVLILIPKYVKSYEIASFSDESFDALILSVLIGKITFTLANVYRPPGNDSSFVRKLEKLLQPVLAKPESLILMGDFNLPDINWNTSTVNVSSQNIHYNFLAFTVLNALHQVVNFPTRDDNLLDLCLTSDTVIISNIECLSPFAASDHNQVCVHLKLKLPNQNRNSFPNFAKANYDGIKNILSSLSWPDLFNDCISTENFYSVFSNILNSLIKQFVPLTPVKISSKKRWPKSVYTLQKEKCIAYRLYKQTRARLDYEKYRTLDKRIQQEQKRSQIAFERSFINGKNDKKFWNFVSSRFGGKQEIPPLKNDDGVVLVSDEKRAEIFGNFFETMYTKDDGLRPPLVHRMSELELHSVSFRSDIVYAELHSLANKFSYGPDGLPAFFLKKLAFELAEPLATIFEVSFRSGILPKIWLEATVTPVFKKGSRTDVKNYRPISLTCVPCKVMEAIVRDKLTNFLTASAIVSPNQHGFLARRSTVTQLLSCLNHWTSAIDNGKLVDVAYLDFASAFTSVSISKLTDILHQIGLRGPMLKWISNFLSGRSQRVRMGSVLSLPKSVSSGVPQGTLLGPLLFLVYINDIDSTVENSKVAIYADDCKVYTSFRKNEPPTELQNDLTRLNAWSNSMQLKLSLPKCIILHIGAQPDAFEYKLGASPLEPAAQIKDLGVTITSDLKSSTHCLLIAKKASQKASCILRFFETKDPKFLFRLFCVYCRPILEYASSAWNPFLKKDIVLLEKVQRSFTKRILYNQNLSYGERLTILESKSLAERRIETDLIMTYKIINGLVAIKVEDFFTLSHISTTRGHPFKIHKPKLNKSVSARFNFFSNRVINIWNQLPEKVVLSKSISNFKFQISQLDFSNHVDYDI